MNYYGKTAKRELNRIVRGKSKFSSDKYGDPLQRKRKMPPVNRDKLKDLPDENIEEYVENQDG